MASLKPISNVDSTLSATSTCRNFVPYPRQPAIRPSGAVCNNRDWLSSRLAPPPRHAQTDEADIAWDVGVDAIDVLDADQIKSGSSAETFTLDILNLWHPETSKQKVRQAMAHAVNCQELIDSLYGGHSVCRGILASS